MNLDLVASEANILRELAREYSEKGYEFIITPGREQLPEFLRSFHPDAVALGERESVVVEIKGSSSSGARRWRGLAEEIRRHEGWRLRVVLAEPATTPEPQRPSIDEIRSQLCSVQRLFQSGERVAGLLLLWSLLEAVSEIRLTQIDESWRPEQRSPEALIKDLISFGLAEQEDYQRMRKLATARNAVAHGYTTTVIGGEDFEFLLDMVRRLVEWSMSSDALAD